MLYFFFFQAEDGIRDFHVTGVQTCALPISIAREEIFGPVLSLLTFDTLDQAIEIANSRMYGLSAGIWTSDINSALVSARRLRAGTVWVNRWMDGYPELPFGGYAAAARA